MPKVSVIVPNYNHARFLPRRIDSILRQTFQDFELILLDDCSTDESRPILSRYAAADPRVKLEFNETNSGSTFKQWNKGVRLAGGEYIWLAESDDYADDRLLERLVGVLNKEPQVTFAYCQSWRVLDDNQPDGFADFYLDALSPDHWKSDFCVDGREECQTYLLGANTVPNASAVVFRRAVYETIGGADGSLRLCGDWKLWVSMALKGKIAYLCAPLNYFRAHDVSVRKTSHKNGLDVLEELRLIRWVLGRVRPSDAILEKVCQSRVDMWVAALMSMQVPSATKLEILRNVRAIDPHPIRRSARSAFRIVQRKLSRRLRSVFSLPTAAEM